MLQEELVYCKSEMVDVDTKTVHLVPFGQHKTDKGDFELDVDGMVSILNSFAGRVNDMVIDYEHQTLSGNEAPAAGWIKSVAAKHDGIWGEVEWTEKAKEYIRNKEYRYISPVFMVDKDRKVVRLVNAALTNQPAIDGMMPLINKEIVKEIVIDTKYIKEKADMFTEEENKELLELLDCKKATRASDVFDVIREMKAKAEATFGSKNITDALGLKENAKEPEVIGTILAMKQGNDNASELSKRVKSLEDALSVKEATEQVELAMSEGKVTPAMKDWAMDYAKTNPEGFKVFVAKAAAIVPLKKAVKDEKQDDQGVDIFTAEQAMVNKMLGITDEQYKKAKEVK